jgi:DNA-binding MarR family transcriptional regulator
MDEVTGVRFALLLSAAWDAMVAEARGRLERHGHGALTVTNEFAMRQIDGGARTAADLARALDVSRQAAAKTIAALEAAGYVGRTDDAADGRRKDLTVTRHGRDALAVGASGFAAAYERWARRIGTERAAEVEDALRALAGLDTSSTGVHEKTT